LGGKALDFREQIAGKARRFHPNGAGHSGPQHFANDAAATAAIAGAEQPTKKEYK